MDKAGSHGCPVFFLRINKPKPISSASLLRPSRCIDCGWFTFTPNQGIPCQVLVINRVGIFVHIFSH